MFAVRLARAATQKMGVIKVEGAYHGGNDILLVSTLVPSNIKAGSDWMPSSVVESAGIPAGANVFGLFETTKSDGTGLGLPIAREIAVAHGGGIEFALVEPHGTVFTVDLPRNGPAV